ncbi:hypothetical protein ISS30_09935 [bacterium]|nr:hypothetical protein [bacterium]
MTGLRRTAYLAVFGAVWGGMEMVMGGILHSMQIPLRGMIMSTIGAFILCAGRLWIGGRGTAVSIGVITAFLKLFSIGGLVLSPAIAIIMESLIAEIVFDIMGAKRLSCLISGMGIVFYSIPHKIFSLLVIYRRELTSLYQTLIEENIELFSSPGSIPVILVVSIYVLLHIAAGASAGLAAYTVTLNVKKRTGSG